MGMEKQSVRVRELLNFIPRALMDQIGDQTNIDYQVKKLTGERIFQLLLYSLIKRRDVSWRILETIFGSTKFQQYASLPQGLRTDHSSLATRLSQIKSEYFEKIHQAATKMLEDQYPTEKIGGYKVVRFDSTMVSLAGTLLKIGGLEHGVNTGKKKASAPVDIKFSVGFNGFYGTKGKIFNEQVYLSEDVALPEIIRAHALSKDEVAVFDRGLNSRKVLVDFTDDNLKFVTRCRIINGKVKHVFVRQVTEIQADKPIETDTLRIKNDCLVYLFAADKPTKCTFRLIEAQRKDTGETLFFITNLMDMDVKDVVLIYRKRWDIECFFKFIKQEFGFNHFLSRSKNGMEVMLYMTLIAFALIHIYFRKNKIDGFKIAKLKFEMELEDEILKIIIEACNGDPNMLDNLPLKTF